MRKAIQIKEEKMKLIDEHLGANLLGLFQRIEPEMAKIMRLFTRRFARKCYDTVD